MEPTSDQDPTEIFQLIERLGEGSYGEVYNALDLRTQPNKVVAVKLIPLESDLDDFKREIDILRGCDNEYIVRYMGNYTKDSELWIVMEYCGAGSVSDLMQICHVTLSEREIADICASALLGLVYLHKRHNIHRDVKAGNILLCPEGQAKLADFGVSAQLSNTLSRRRTVVGTPFWMAPEVIQEVSYDGKADIWSLGITVIEMAQGEPPHSHIHPMRAIFMIPSRPPPTLAEPDKWTPEMVDFVNMCLKKDPAERPTAEELLAHPFVSHNVAQLRSRSGVSPALSELVERHMPTICEYRDSQFAEGAEEAGAGGGAGGTGGGDATGAGGYESGTVVRADGSGGGGGGGGGSFGTVRRPSPRGTRRTLKGASSSGGGTARATNVTGTMVYHGGEDDGGAAAADGEPYSTGTMVFHGTTGGAADTGTMIHRPGAGAGGGGGGGGGGTSGSMGEGGGASGTSSSFMDYFRGGDGASTTKSTPADAGRGGGGGGGEGKAAEGGHGPHGAGRRRSGAMNAGREGDSPFAGKSLIDLRSKLEELDTSFERAQAAYKRQRAALVAAISEKDPHFV